MALCHTHAVLAPSLPPVAGRMRAALGRLVAEHPRRAVVGAAAVMVAAQLGFRAWALLPSYFYLDDYRLVSEARSSGWSLAALAEPYEAQFMPYGRAVAWVAAQPERLSWPLMAATTLGAQALASVGCVWMLFTLFGPRWAALAPLALYLSSPITMPALMWWAAGVNQVPLQAAFFGAVAAWVHYLRGRRAVWLLVTAVVLALGLLCYVKVLLVFPVLAALAIGWFATGGPLQRIVHVVRHYWPAVALGVVGGVAFLAFYLASPADRLVSPDRPAGAGRLAGEMLGRALPAALTGGPWRWDRTIAPVAISDPPTWAVLVSWLVILTVITVVARHRVRSLRAWALLAAYAGLDYLLLLTTRAQVIGPIIGREYRYLTDAACVAVLAVSLACLELRDAPGSSRSRTATTARPGRRLVTVAVALAVVSGLSSSVAYAAVWHDHHPGARYFGQTLSSLPFATRTDGSSGVDLADQRLPTRVTGALGAPLDSSAFVLPDLDPQLLFPDRTERLHVLDPDGRIVDASVDALRTSVPGPVPGCGWEVRDTGAEIPLDDGVYDSTWWLRIRYLSSQDTGLRVRAGRTDTVVDVRRDLGTVFLRVEGAFSTVSLSGLDPGVALCLDSIAVGTPEPEDAP